MNYPPDFPSVLVPHYVSDEGNMFFKDDTLTQWATKKCALGVEFPAMKGWRVETPHNGRYYVLTDNGVPIFEGRDRNECVDHIDLMKAATKVKVNENASK